jgi:hypothetical protein
LGKRYPVPCGLYAEGECEHALQSNQIQEIDARVHSYHFDCGLSASAFNIRHKFHSDDFNNGASPAIGNCNIQAGNGANDAG